MKHLGIGLLCGIAAYVLVAVISYFLIMQFSSNTHDRQMEAGTTSAFITGPLGAILGGIVGYLWSEDAF